MTSRRTAATAAVATDVLAPPALGQVGLLAPASRRERCSARSRGYASCPCVKVFSPTPANRAAFADEMGARLEIEIQPVASAEAALRDSDLVACAVRAGSSQRFWPSGSGRAPT